MRIFLYIENKSNEKKENNHHSCKAKNLKNQARAMGNRRPPARVRASLEFHLRFIRVSCVCARAKHRIGARTLSVARKRTTAMGEDVVKRTAKLYDAVCSFRGVATVSSHRSHQSSSRAENLLRDKLSHLTDK